VINLLLSLSKQHGSKEDEMNYKLEKMEMSQFYRGNELPSAQIESPEQLDSGNYTQSHPAVDSKPSGIEGLSKEREEELNVFMDDIKEFIRSIDISKL
jgi:hypothetical protein